MYATIPEHGMLIICNGNESQSGMNVHEFLVLFYICMNVYDFQVCTSGIQENPYTFFLKVFIWEMVKVLMGCGVLSKTFVVNFTHKVYDRMYF